LPFVPAWWLAASTSLSEIGDVFIHFFQDGLRNGLVCPVLRPAALHRNGRERRRFWGRGYLLRVSQMLKRKFLACSSLPR
jgi:hypothetical protein